MDKSFDLNKLLKNHEHKHKAKPTQFSSVANGVKKRLANNLQASKNKRLSVFDRLRTIETTKSPVKVSRVKKEENRRLQLEKWKEEREKQKKEAAAQKKKPFVAGVAHNTLRSIPPPPPKPSTSGCVTRARALKNSKSNEEKKGLGNSKSFAPQNAKFRAPLNLIEVPKLQPVRTRAAKNANVIAFAPVNAKPMKSISNKKKSSKMENKAPLSNSNAINIPNLDSKTLADNKTPKKMKKNPKDRIPKKSLPKSESKPEEKLRSPKLVSPKAPEQLINGSSKISPSVTLSRGKENARKEVKKKLEEGLLDDDVCDRDSIIHLRQQLASETEQITSLCDTWNKINEQTQLPEFVQEYILGAVGQARLLMSQKMAQFASLVDRCERPDPAQTLVTPTDLHGFWDMVFMQIENVYVRFNKLDELKERGWVEETVKETVTETAPKMVKPAVKRTAKPAAGPSRLREMIAAARKAKKEQTVQPADPALDKEGSKTFDAGFFSIQSPVKSPSTPNCKVNILKSVLSNETKKASSASKSNASFAMLRASLFSKNIENDGISFLPQTPMNQINLQATPGPSILKSAKKTEKKSGKKSIKLVFFNESSLDIKDTSATIENGNESAHGKENEEKRVEDEFSSNIIENNNLTQQEVTAGKGSSRRSSKSKRYSVAECNLRPMVTRSMCKSMQNQSLIDVD